MKVDYKSVLQLIRFDDPIGTCLLLWPTLWALWIAAQGFPSFLVLTVFVLGGIFVYAAATIFNDITDRKFDGKVTRTKNRPLVTGKISVKLAWVLCFGLLLCAFGLVMLLNGLTILLAVTGFVFACIYPFSKRFTHWAQLFLGIATAWGVPMAFAAQTNELPILCWLLFVIAALWPIIYDTMCAMIDKDDDKKIGVKSTAILFSENIQLFLVILQLLMILLLIFLGIFGGLGIPYYLGLLGTCGLFYYQYKLIEKHAPEDCLKSYKNNNWIGGILFVGIALSFIF